MSLFHSAYVDNTHKGTGSQTAVGEAVAAVAWGAAAATHSTK
jgi:hypothetical protein